MNPLLNPALCVLGFVFFVLFAAGSYGTGLLLHQVWGRRRVESWNRVFEHSLTGMLFIVSAYAACVTRGQTVLLLLLPLSVMLSSWFSRITEEADRAVSPRRLITVAGMALVAVYVVYLLLLCSRHSGEITIWENDMTYFSNTATALNRYGRENPLAEFFYPERATTGLYHFGDLWAIAMTSRLTPLNGSYAIALVVYPFFTTLFYFGILALLSSLGLYGPADNMLRPAFVLGVFVAAGFSFFYPPFLNIYDGTTMALINAPKVIIIGVFILAILLYYLRDQYRLMMAMACAGALFFMSIAFTYLVLAGLITLAAWLRGRIVFREFLRVTLIAVTTVVFVAAFYFTTGTEHISFYTTSASLIAKDGITEHIRPLGKNLIALSIYVGHLILALWIIYKFRRGSIAVRHKSLINKMWLLITALFVSGSAGLALTFNQFPDSWQLYSLAILPLASVCIIVISYYGVFRSGKPAVTLLIVGALLINCIEAFFLAYPYRYRSLHTFNAHDVQKAIAFIRTPEPRFAFYQLVDTGRVYSYSSNVTEPMFILSYLFDPYICPAFNGYNVPLGSDQRNSHFMKTIINNSSSAHFAAVSGYKRALDSEHAYKRFITDNRISYLFYPESVPVHGIIRPMILDSVRLGSEHVNLYRLVPPASNF